MPSDSSTIPTSPACLDVWNDATGTYVVSRLARGTTLQELRASGSLTVAASEAVMRQVRAALDHGHGCGVGHGGLNESEILIDADGNAHVAGWGVMATAEVLAADDEAVSLLAAGLGVDQPLPTGSRRNPYRGLAAFHESEAQWFFGRERAVDELSTAIADQAFITIIGASGSGKSSLMGAGLAAALRAGNVVQFEGWEIVSLSPTVHPRETLSSAIERCVTGRSSHRPGPHHPLRPTRGVVHDGRSVGA